MGLSKWGLPLAYLGPLQPVANWLGRWAHAVDMRIANKVGWGLWPCMTVLLKLRKRRVT